MKIQKLTTTVAAIAGLALFAGCSNMGHNSGASADRDNNVLTGGPKAGTTLADLPVAVRQTLQKNEPSSEIADIDKRERNGRVYYQISFKGPGKNPVMFIQQDGKILTEEPAK